MRERVPGPQPLAVSLQGVERITAAHVLCVNVSMKPAPGLSTPSSCRSLLMLAARTVAAAYPAIAVLDLRENPLPWFDGRTPAEMPRHPVGTCHQSLTRSGGLYLAIPAYWRAVSGSFKNFVEVLSGPAYDHEQPVTPFTGKSVGYFVVGADDESAAAADRQAGAILESLGARVVGNPVVIGNPAGSPELVTLAAQRIVIELGSLAQRVASAARAPR